MPLWGKGEKDGLGGGASGCNVNNRLDIAQYSLIIRGVPREVRGVLKSDVL